VRVTAVMNSKGGTAKTTTAVTLAALAAQEGRRCLIVDMDKQASATKQLGGSPDNDDLIPGLLGERALASLIQPTSVDDLDLVPGSVALANPARLVEQIGHHTLLRSALEDVEGYDWVLIDTPGDLAALTIMSLTAATDVLVPISLGTSELDEVPLIQAAISTTRKRLNPHLKLAGVVVTKVPVYGRNPAGLLSPFLVQLQKDFPGKVLDTYVRQSVSAMEAHGWRRPLTVHDPGGRIVADYRAVLHALDGAQAVAHAG